MLDNGMDCENIYARWLEQNIKCQFLISLQNEDQNTRHKSNVEKNRNSSTFYIWKCIMWMQEDAAMDAMW